MRNSPTLKVSVALALMVVLLSGSEAWPRSRHSRQGSGRRPAEEWSRTSPPINVTHIFEGEINSRGKPVGFHSRPGGRDPQGARLVRVIDRPNRAGVYTADVEIRSGSDWLPNRSTLYPDPLDRSGGIQAALHAFSWRTTAAAEQL